MSPSESDGLCNIPRVGPELASRLRDIPHVIVADGAAVNRNTEFASQTEREALVRGYGQYRVTLASANTQSYIKKKATLGEYLSYMAEIDSRERANETWYWFGDDQSHFGDFLDKYSPPPGAEEFDYTLTFGVGTQFSGVRFDLM